MTTVVILAATALLQAGSAGPEDDLLQRPFGVMFSAPTAYREGLSRVCLPLIAEAQPLAEIERREHLVRVGGEAVHASPADHVYKLPTLSPAYAIAWADGTCSISVSRGKSQDFLSSAQALLSARPEGFKAGPTRVLSTGQSRTLWCAASRPRPVIVSTAVRRDGGVISTVYRSGSDDPADCGG